MASKAPKDRWRLFPQQNLWGTLIGHQHHCFGRLVGQVRSNGQPKFNPSFARSLSSNAPHIFCCRNILSAVNSPFAPLSPRKPAIVNRGPRTIPAARSKVAVPHQSGREKREAGGGDRVSSTVPLASDPALAHCPGQHSVQDPCPEKGPVNLKPPPFCATVSSLALSTQTVVVSVDCPARACTHHPQPSRLCALVAHDRQRHGQQRQPPVPKLWEQQ